MNSFALPAVGAMGRNARLGSDTELVRRAIAGNTTAFDELYRRHAPSAWRIGAAVVPDPARAVAAVAEGFVHALRVGQSQRVGRNQPAGAESFRSDVVAGTYRAGLDLLGAGAVAGPAATRNHLVGNRVDGDQDALRSAFFELPERWRAALWLTEVEGQDTAAVGAVIGVGTAVAGPLSARALVALAARLGTAVPDPLGPALSRLAAVMPAALESEAVARWRRSIVIDPGTRFAFLTDWLGNRARRNLAIAAGGLLALGVVGFGVMTQDPGVGGYFLGSPSTPAASGAVQAPPALARPVTGALAPILARPTPVHHARATVAAAYPHVELTISGSHTRIAVAHHSAAPPTTHTTTVTPPAGGHAAGGTTSHVGTGITRVSGTATSHPSSPGGTVTSGGGGTTTGSGGGTTGGGGGTASTTSGQTPVVDVPGVAGISTGSSGTTVTVGDPSSPVAGVTTCSTGIGVTIVGIPVNLGSCPTASGSGTTGTTSTGSSSGTSGTSGSTTTGSGSSGRGSSGSSGSGSSGSGSSGSGSTGSTGSSGGLGGLLGGLGL